jgi:hypothetical protein
MLAKYPKDFSTSDADSLRWHQQEAMQAEVEGNWRAVAFHLEWIHKLDPESAFYALHQKLLRQAVASTNPVGDLPR